MVPDVKIYKGKSKETQMTEEDEGFFSVFFKGHCFLSARVRWFIFKANHLKLQIDRMIH